MSSLVAIFTLVLFFVLALRLEGSSTETSYRQQLQPGLQNPTTEWPSLRLNFSLKRSAMAVHSQSDFSLIAEPVVLAGDSRVVYNVFATFQQDSVVHNYTLVDGTAYYVISNADNIAAPVTAECMGPGLDELPPINAIAASLNQATPITSVSSGMDIMECSKGNLFRVSVDGNAFALCASGLSGFQMYRRDMNIAVEYSNTRMSISAPARDQGKLRGCPAMASPFAVTSTGKALLTGRPIPFEAPRRLKAEFDFSWGDSSTCSCKSTPRPCIFIHGMGVRTELPENQDSLKYWGNVTVHAPCCSSIKYAVLNTVNNTWTNDTQQQKVCDRALAVSETSTESTITDTIVVTHSMGNLMLAGAIASGKCSLASSSTWVGIAAPMKGSMASDFIQESCAGNSNFVVEAMVEHSGRCPPTTALKSMPYEGGSHSTAELDAAYRAAQEAYRTNVSALMCSESFSGLLSTRQPVLWALGIVGRHHSRRNDGMVEFDSCAVGIPASKFGDTWRDRFYRTKLNHYDMQFRFGDALFDKAKMPLKWFECLL